MAGPSKIMQLVDEDICDKSWKENKFSVNSQSEFSCDSDCDSNMIVTFLSSSKQSDSSDDSDMQHGTWTKVAAEQPLFHLVINLV
jgi:hypothetical protein